MFPKTEGTQYQIIDYLQKPVKKKIATVTCHCYHNDKSLFQCQSKAMLGPVIIVCYLKMHYSLGYNQIQINMILFLYMILCWHTKYLHCVL